MPDSHQNYVSPKLEARENPAKGSQGLYAHQPVQKGELLLVWGGRVVDREGLEHIPPEFRLYSVQVEENLYLVTDHDPDPGDFINHSCNPNGGLIGQISIIALRDIQPGEEICFDYATSDGSPYDEFECACGAPECRGRVTGDDWRIPELWQRYQGHFSPYLQRRIDRLREAEK